MSDLRAMNVIAHFTLAVDSAEIARTFASASVPMINGTMNGHMVRRMILSVVDGGDVMWRADGGPPQALNAHILESDGSISFTGANYRGMFKNMQFLPVAATAMIFGTALIRRY